MADTRFGKKIEETSSSSSSIPLITHRQQLVAKSPPSQTSTKVVIPKKVINILRSERPEYRRMARAKLMEILNERRNPDVGKSVVVDIFSDDEFDEVHDEI